MLPNQLPRQGTLAPALIRRPSRAKGAVQLPGVGDSTSVEMFQETFAIMGDTELRSAEFDGDFLHGDTRSQQS